MKAVLTLCLLCSFAFVVGCSSTDSSTNPIPTDASGDYFPLSVGSYWKYNTSDSTATRAVVGTATLLGKSYFAIHDYAADDTTYIRRSGSKVYVLVPDSTGLGLIELLYMDETAGSHDTVDLSFFGLVVHTDRTVTAVTGSRVVNGKTYSDLRLLHMVETSSFGTSTSDVYFAKGVGEIEDIEDSVSVETLVDYRIF